MSTNQKLIEKFLKSNAIVIIILSFLAMCLGYYMLNHIAPQEKPLLGNTFHIIMGCVLIAGPFILMVLAIKAKYFPKKSHKKRSKPVFLNDNSKGKKR